MIEVRTQHLCWWMQGTVLDRLREELFHSGTLGGPKPCSIADGLVPIYSENYMCTGVPEAGVEEKEEVALEQQIGTHSYLYSELSESSRQPPTLNLAPSPSSRPCL